MNNSAYKPAGRAFILALAGLMHVNVLGLSPAEAAEREKLQRNQRQLEQKRALVERVLFHSPLGELAASGPDGLAPEVYEAWVAAGLAFELAVEAMERDNGDAADESLDSALAHYRKASAIDREARVEDADYASRLLELKGRVQGYRDSLNRIRAEKGAPAGGDASVDRIDEAMAAAEIYEQQGEPKKAEQVLQALQLALESELVSARSGETLVSRVSFATPAEAFEYEIRKCRSNEELLEVLFNGGSLDAARRDLGLGFLRESRRASERAVEINGRGDSEEALRVLESAHDAQTRALRLLGVGM